jgi:hypothetical protein
MCYEFERWNWKLRAGQRDQKVVPTQSSKRGPDERKPVQAKEPAHEVKVEEKVPA